MDISLQSCGYYCIPCGYGIALWIVDITLFQAERLQNWATFTKSQSPIGFGRQILALQPEERNRRAERNRRSSQKDKNRKRKAQGNVGVMVAHEAEGTKTRGAAETSYEVTHVPDPLHLTVDGGTAEDIQAETINPGWS